ncbi:FAD-dependent oxidoreductase [Texcoconibacillus texcoconensis]|uniref:Thioredoxin reductase n=1 Tax=Texcoconibacillus texcoconensis TaxID=1095777 RepID=A0A840QLY0_9BACI|nr:FAD-dependent oxidoreductase [Texcoconibacillus texcoconensis]MBB5172378.1 thioredoxin reductase [Texcoconibacillus texcoconensis]
MYDVIVIGGGPAGGSAALFTSKAGKGTLVLDNDKGVTKKAWMDNHYGVDGISGPDLVEVGKKQATKFGTEWVEDTATAIQSENGKHIVKTEAGNTYEAKHVVLATGMTVQLAEDSGITTVDGTEPRIKKIIKVDEQGKTNVDGIWAAGTVAGVSMHTIITAGDAGKVAINIVSELNGERYVDHDILK